MSQFYQFKKFINNMFNGENEMGHHYDDHHHHHRPPVHCEPEPHCAPPVVVHHYHQAPPMQPILNPDPRLAMSQPYIMPTQPQQYTVAPPPLDPRSQMPYTMPPTQSVPNAPSQMEYMPSPVAPAPQAVTGTYVQAPPQVFQPEPKK